MGSRVGGLAGEHLLVAALGDDDGFGEAVLGAAAVRMDEELDEPEAGLQRGCAVAERTLHRVPEGEVRVNNGDHANLQEALAGRAALALPEQDAEVKHRHDDVGKDVEELIAQAALLVPAGVLGQTTPEGEKEMCPLLEAMSMG